MAQAPCGYGARRKSIFQLTSQVLPASGEYACSQRAEPLLREVLALRSPPLPASDLRVVEVKARLAIALDQLGRGDEAQALRAEIEAPLKKSRSPYAADLVAALGAKTPRAAPPSSH